MRSFPSTLIVSSVILQKRIVGREAGTKGRTLKRKDFVHGIGFLVFRST